MTMFALRYLGDGDFKALHPARADKELTIGEVLKWETVTERSGESHRHFFAVVNDAWANLPESLILNFPNPDALRKYCLIKAGFCRTYTFACKSKLEAKTALKAIQEADGYALAELTGNVLTVWVAESQSMRAMGSKKRFQESKDAVFRILSELIGADVAQHAGRAA